MWTELLRAPNLMIAELWKEALDNEGISTMIAPDVSDWVGVTEDTPRRIMVPVSRKHVAEEVLRKL